MAFPFIAAATIGSSLLNYFGQQQSDNENSNNQRNYNAEQYRLARESEERNMAMQREFAQNGVSWKVEDAKRAGIHPLYAMGGNGASYTPTIAVGGGAPPQSNNTLKNLGQMGQDVTRAIYSTSVQAARDKAMFDVNLENSKLQNELLKSQINRINQPPNPPLPSNSGMIGLTGQGNWTQTGNSNAYVQENPLNRLHSQPGRPGQDVGAISDYAYVRTSKGYAVVPSKDVKERIEDQIVPETMWAIRNQLIPAIKGLPAPDPRYYTPPRGFNAWKWSPMHQEFRPAHQKSKWHEPTWR